MSGRLSLDDLIQACNNFFSKDEEERPNEDYPCEGEFLESEYWRLYDDDDFVSETEFILHELDLNEEEW